MAIQYNGVFKGVQIVVRCDLGTQVHCELVPDCPAVHSISILVGNQSMMRSEQVKNSFGYTGDSERVLRPR